MPGIEFDYPVNSTNNVTILDETRAIPKTDVIQSLIVIEIICVMWFLIEFLIRFVCCPNKLEFFKSILNWIDFISVVPYVVWILLIDYSVVPGVRNILRMLKILVVFKIARFSFSLKSFGSLVTHASRELAIIFVYLTVGVVFYSTILYYSEKDNFNTKFTSIPATFW